MSKGEIGIDLGKFNFSPGEIIKGRLTLFLKKPIRARQLRISLVGERRSSNISYSLKE